MTEPKERRCRYTSTHAAHEYRAIGKLWNCPGREHVPHNQRCCVEHGTHSDPHIGCILR